MPNTRTVGNPGLTAAAIRQRMLIYYCRFFLESFRLDDAVHRAADGYPYFQDSRRNHYIPVFIRQYFVL